MRQTATYYKGTRLAEILQSQERSQAWLARKVGCSQSLVSRILSGERRIPAWFAERCANELDLPIDVLFFDRVLSEERVPLSMEAA